jgi:hypothetical protein
MQTVTTRQELEEIFDQLPPVELLGLALLRRHQAGHGFFPAHDDPEELAQATVELIDYMATCQSMADRLGDLLPVVLEIPIPEFSL